SPPAGGEGRGEGAPPQTPCSQRGPLTPTLSHAGRACPTCALLMPKSGKPDFGRGRGSAGDVPRCEVSRRGVRLGQSTRGPLMPCTDFTRRTLLAGLAAAPFA